MTDLPLQFHPDARNDAIEAHAWYAERSQAAADAFLNELEAAGTAIQNAPDRWAEYLYGTRRYLFRRFPFAVVYRVTTDRIEILAVAHGRRKPGFWQPRVSE